MENRRHGATSAPKPFRSGRSKNKHGEKADQRNYNSRQDNSTTSHSGYAKKRHFEAKSDKFQPSKRFTPKTKDKQSWKKEPPKVRIVSDLQITDGKHRGKYLKTSKSPKVQPTKRRIREILFRILYRQVNAGRFLDLCSGAGTIGLEAISRGAIVCTFVERSAKMCSFVKANLENLGIKEGHGEIFETEAVSFLKQMAKRRRFWDVVYFNPPFDSDYDEVLKYFERGVPIRPGGILVIEHHAEMFFPEKIGMMKRWKVVVEGDTAISFFERKS